MQPFSEHSVVTISMLWSGHHEACWANMFVLRRRHRHPVPDPHQLRPPDGRRGVLQEALRAGRPAGLPPQGSAKRCVSRARDR